MLGATGLLGVGVRAVRHQGWLVLVLGAAHAVTRLLQFVPWILIGTLLVSAGRSAGASDTWTALSLGVPVLLADPSAWMLSFAGLVLGVVGSWLLVTVMEAAILRRLAAQVGRDAPTDDDSFEEGLINLSGNALLTAGLAGTLTAFSVTCSFLMVVAGLSLASEEPGVLAAFMMTIATTVLLCVPILMAAMDAGFARAIILCEGPLTALAGGLQLTWRRAGAFLPIWYVLVLLQAVLALALGGPTASVGALGGRVAAVAVVGALWLIGVVAVAAVAIVRLSVCAALVCEDAGKLPEPERVLLAIPVVEPLPDWPPGQDV